MLPIPQLSVEPLSTSFGEIVVLPLAVTVTVMSLATQTGAIVSSIITFWFWVTDCPLPSLNVQVTIVVPWVVIGKTVEVVPEIAPAQASVVVGIVGSIAVTLVSLNSFRSDSALSRPYMRRIHE